MMVVIEGNTYHGSKFHSWSLSTMGGVYEKQSEVLDYFSLHQANEVLATENAILKELIIRGTSKSTTAFLSLQDPLSSVDVDFIPAKVVNASVANQHNLLTINIGSSDSVAVDMAVVGPLGVVGVVKSVSAHYAMVLPLINVQYRVSSKLRNNDFFGTLRWDTNDYRYASLEGIELHVDVSVGDTVVTSGFGAIFPEGVVVGTVREITDGEEGVFHDVQVQLATDFKRVSYVYVLKDNGRDERLLIENANNN